MSLEQLAYLSQIAAGAAVVASLLFVGVQVRQFTDAMAAQTRQHVASSWFIIAQLVSDNADAFGAGLTSENAGFADLSPEDRLKFVSVIFALYKHYENIFLEYRAGRIDEATWAPWSTHMLIYFHQPGVQSWWAIRKHSFALAFQAYLEGSQKPDAPSPAALLRQPRAEARDVR